jgi:hypothetical protein
MRNWRVSALLRNFRGIRRRNLLTWFGTGARRFKSSRPDFLFKRFRASDLDTLLRSEDFPSTNSSTAEIPDRPFRPKPPFLLFFFEPHWSRPPAVSPDSPFFL